MRTLFLLFFCLVSCSRQGPWHYSEVYTDCNAFNSANLFYCATNRFTGIEVQFLKGSFGTACFLNVACREIPSFRGDPKKALAVIEIEGVQYPYLALKMDGDQKAVLPEEASHLLIEALCQKKEVTVYLEGYMTKVLSGRFCDYFEKMNKVPI